MQINLQSFSLQKAGNRPEEYEDAFFPKRRGVFDQPAFRFAIADGATESSFAGLWAYNLVISYCCGPITVLNFQSRVEKRGRKWTQEVMAKPLPWFALEKVQYGAFAALLGLSLTTNGTESFTGHWTAFAAGDSCLFHVRHPELLVCFPIERADQFNNHPVLLSTNPLKNQLLSEVADKLEWRGQWQVGDQFLLMTDALAQWFMVQVEQGEQPWLTLKEVASHSQLLSGAFNTWITDLRTSKNIRNDDVTLLMIDITGA